MGDKLKAGEAYKAGNKRYNARQAAQRRRKKQMAEAEQRQIERDRELQQDLKRQFYERQAA